MGVSGAYPHRPRDGSRATPPRTIVLASAWCSCYPSSLTRRVLPQMLTKQYRF